MGSSMSTNVSEETRRSPRTNRQSEKRREHLLAQDVLRCHSPRSVEHHPCLVVAVSTPQLLPALPLSLTMLEPTQELCEMIRQSLWEASRFRLRTHPRDATWHNDQGETPLHMACRYRAPSALLMDLIKIWPVALWTPDLVGWIPLHVMLVHHTTRDEYAVLQLIRAGGKAAVSYRMHSNDHGPAGMALHLACRHGVSRSILCELLCLHPEAVYESKPCFPADLLWKQMKRHAEMVVDQTSVIQQWNLLMAAAQGLSLQEIDVCTMDANQPMFTLHKVLDFQYTCTDISSKTSITNTKNPDLCNNFVELYLQIYPEAVKWVDPMTGSLPLHLACAHQFRTEVKMSNNPSVWMTVLENYPQAAVVRDNIGRLPLHIALLTGDGGDGGFVNHMTLIKHLVAANPEALECCCPESGMWPFQMAACRLMSLQDNDNVMVDTVYELLRASPLQLTRDHGCMINKIKTTQLQGLR